MGSSTEASEDEALMLRRLCQVQHRRWLMVPWKLARAEDESDDAYKARSEAGAATHGWNGMHLHRFDHRPWSCERADHATPGWIGVRCAPRRGAARSDAARPGRMVVA